jgi:hypothetical protein
LVDLPVIRFLLTALLSFDLPVLLGIRPFSFGSVRFVLGGNICFPFDFGLFILQLAVFLLDYGACTITLNVAKFNSMGRFATMGHIQRKPGDEGSKLKKDLR